ncbi:MAG: NAD-dependent epimerase/dehydratase family protein [Alphaproteobacteria bacterium]
MKHYLVTGGCGFIGSHLSYALAKQGNRVTILDDLSGGLATNCSAEATLVQGSILDTVLLESLMNMVDGCFHLAAVTSTQRCNEEWEKSHTINATGTLNVFSQARQRKIPVVYASSAAVYGHQQEFPIREDAVINPISSYGCDKYHCELQGRIADLIHNVPTIGIRFFNVYGPLQDPLNPYSGVISAFIHRAINHKDLVIFGDGSQVRDFLYISDAVMALMAAMEKLHNEKRGHYVVNACTGEEATISALAHHIIDLTDSQGQCLYRKSRKGDIYESIGDPSLLNELLGVSAQMSIVDGLSQTLEWMKGRLALRKHIREKLPFKRNFDDLRKLGASIAGMLFVFCTSQPVYAEPVIQPQKWAAFYKTDVNGICDIAEVKDYSLLILQPNTCLSLKPLQAQGKKLLGYLSLTEIYKEEPFFAKAQTLGLLVKENANWPGSYLIDLRSKDWAKHILEEKVPTLLKQGFAGILIDTVDDVTEIDKIPKHEGTTQAVILLIKEIRRQHPTIIIMMNRGYKILPFVAKDIDMIMSESLFGEYDFRKKTYSIDPAENYKDQLKIIKAAQIDNPKLGVYPLDYWDPKDPTTLREIYQKGRDRGFFPYVAANVNLDEIIKEPPAFSVSPAQQ